MKKQKYNKAIKTVEVKCPECGKEFNRDATDGRCTCPKCSKFFIDIDLPDYE